MKVNPLSNNPSFSSRSESSFSATTKTISDVTNEFYKKNDNKPLQHDSDSEEDEEYDEYNEKEEKERMNENQNNGIRKNTDISDRYAVVGGTANYYLPTPPVGYNNPGV